MKKLSIALMHFWCMFTYAYGEQTGKELAAEAWQKISAIEPQYSRDFLMENTNLNNEENVYLYWEQIAEQCQDIFFEYLNKNQDEQDLFDYGYEFASYLGSKGTDEDLKWALACPPLTLNNFSILWSSEDILNSTKLLQNHISPSK